MVSRSVTRETLSGRPTVVSAREVAVPPLAAATRERLEAIVTALLEEPDPPTGHRTRRDIWQRDILDSLAALALPTLQRSQDAVDLGCGIGFPGLALAAALPATRFTLVDSIGRRLQVAANLVRRAGLENVELVNARIEDFARGPARERFTLATARALAPIVTVLELAAPLLAVSGALVVWRGRLEPAERDRVERVAAQLGLVTTEIRRVLPFEGAKHRHLHVFTKQRPTPERFPRRPGLARKRPLA